jgi:hypothetical protein
VVDDSPQGSGYGAILRLVAELRDDMREDNRRLEDRVMGAVSELRNEQRQSIEAHAKDHLTAAIATESELGQIRLFMRNAELAQARRDGTLGVFRFVLEQLSRHWQPLAGVLMAAAAAALAVAGNIRIQVGLG